jgi:parvulin-like peptidyl-prolyl isomerase
MRKFSYVLLLGSVLWLSTRQPLASNGAVGHGRALGSEVARVNGVPLGQARLDVALNRLLPYESFHRSISQERVDQLRQQALVEIVDEELEYQEGLRRGVRVSEPRLEQEVASVERRYGTRAALLEALKASGASFEDLETELRRRLVVEEVVRAEVTAKCQATDEDASAFFAANPERFIVPEAMHVYALTIGVDPSGSTEDWHQAKVRAEFLRQQIAAGASFEALAREYSTDAARAKGGDMGFVHRGSMLDEFEQAISTLPPRHPSKVIQSLYGYHVIQVTDVRPPRPQTFTEVAGAIRKDLTSRQCDARRLAWISELRARSAIVMIGPAA